MASAADDIDLPSLSSPVLACGNNGQRYRDGYRNFLLAKIGRWQPPVIGHGILAGKYLTEYRDSLK